MGSEFGICIQGEAPAAKYSYYTVTIPIKFGTFLYSYTILVWNKFVAKYSYDWPNLYTIAKLM